MAVEPANVEAERIAGVPVAVEAAFSPKVNPVLSAVVNCQFQAWAKSALLMLLDVVAAVIEDNVRAVAPLPVSAEQVTLPEMSVVNLPPLPKPEQLYPVRVKTEPIEAEAPIPTLPEKVWAAVQVLALLKFREATTAPVVGEMVKVPSVLETELIELVTVELKLIDPPSETDPPPAKPVPVLIVIVEFDRAELGILVMVLFEPLMVLFVRVWAAVSKTTLPVAFGNVIVWFVVGVQVKVPVGPPD